MTNSGWQCVTRDTGGTIAAFACAGGFAFAATPVGVYRSADAGQSWTLPGRGASPTFVETLAVTADTVLAGGATGLHRSDDQGQSWQHILAGARVLACAACDNLVQAGTESDGVLRSEDAGRSWSGANAGLLDLTVTALAVSPNFEEDRLAFAATPSGVYRSRNAGRSWRAIEMIESSIECLAVAEDGIVLAGTSEDGMLRSTDGGTIWESVSDLAGRSVTAIALAAEMVVAATEEGIVISSDCGASWHVYASADVASALSLASVGVLLAGVQGDGVLRSTDRGRTWHSANRGLNARLRTGLAVSSGNLLVSSADEGISLSNDGGSTWTQRLGDTPVYCLATSAPDDVVYAATSDGLLVSRDSGSSWAASDPAISAADARRPIRLVAADKPVVVAALEGQTLVLQHDNGDSWHTVSTPFGAADVLSLVVARRHIVAAIRQPDELVVSHTTDVGASWHRLIADAATNVSVAPVAICADRVLVGIGDRVLRDDSHATPLGNDVTTVTSLATAGDTTVLAATNAGVFVSHDAGASFQPWSDGLDPPRILALAISSDYVFALGLGGALWRRPFAAITEGSR